MESRSSQLRVRFSNAVDWCFDYGNVICGALSSLLLAGLAFVEFRTLPFWLLLLFGGSFALIAGIIGKKRVVSSANLEREMAALKERDRKTREALCESIEQIGKNLCGELQLWSPEVRLTVYAHDDVTSSFVPLARVSDNPVFARKHRVRYPDDQGYLAKVWVERRYSFARKQLRTVRRESLEGGLSEALYDSLPLKPRSLIGKRLEKDQKPIGVVLWESSDKDKINPKAPELYVLDDNETLKDLTSVVCASSALFLELSEHFLRGSDVQSDSEGSPGSPP